MSQAISKHYENLENLRQRIPDIVLPLSEVTIRKEEGRVEYEQLSGNVSEAIRVARNSGMAICEWNAKAGDEFISHRHEIETEFAFFFEGVVIFSIEGKEDEIISAPKYLKIPPGMLHSFSVLKDVRAFFVSIPAIEGYP